MMALDQPIQLNLTAGEVQVVLGGLAELPFKISATTIDKIKTQVLEVDPEAFQPPAVTGTTVVPPNGRMPG